MIFHGSRDKDRGPGNESRVILLLSRPWMDVPGHASWESRSPMSDLRDGTPPLGAAVGSRHIIDRCVRQQSDCHGRDTFSSWSTAPRGIPSIAGSTSTNGYGVGQEQEMNPAPHLVTSTRKRYKPKKRKRSMDLAALCCGSPFDAMQNRRIARLEERVQMMETPPVRGRQLHMVYFPPQAQRPPTDEELMRKK